MVRTHAECRKEFGKLMGSSLELEFSEPLMIGSVLVKGLLRKSVSGRILLVSIDGDSHAMTHFSNYSLSLALDSLKASYQLQQEDKEKSILIEWLNPCKHMDFSNVFKCINKEFNPFEAVSSTILSFRNADLTSASLSQLKDYKNAVQKVFEIEENLHWFLENKKSFGSLSLSDKIKWVKIASISNPELSYAIASLNAQRDCDALYPVITNLWFTDTSKILSSLALLNYNKIIYSESSSETLKILCKMLSCGVKVLESVNLEFEYGTYPGIVLDISNFKC